MVAGVEKERLSSRERVTNNIITSRKKEIAATFGTPFNAGSDPMLWKPYHTLENFRSTHIVETIFDAALTDPTLRPTTDIRLRDLQTMQLAASLFYPDFNNMYRADDSLAREEMSRADIFDERDFVMVPPLIKAATSKESSDPQEVPTFKGIAASSDFAFQRKIFSDAMNNFAVLPDTMFLIALMGIERLYDSARKGNADAIRTADGRLPRNLIEVMRPSTTYDNDIIRAQIEVEDKYFFGPESTPYVPLLSTTPRHLAYFDLNKAFFTSKVLPLVQEDTVDLTELLHITSVFSGELKEQHIRERRGLLD